MAKFTSTVPLNIRLPGGFEVSGAAGATHRIPDSLVDEFERDQSPGIPGFAWVIQDETTDKLSRTEGGVVTGATSVKTLNGTVFADQYSTLAAAIAAAPAAGGRVVVPAGTYTLSASLSMSANTNLVIEGEGERSVIDGSALGNGVHAISISSPGARVRNVRVVAPTGAAAGDAIRITATGCSLEGVTVSGGLNGITTTSLDTQVRGCRITSSTATTGGYGVLVTGAAHRAVVVGNTFVACRIGAGVVDSSSFAVISGNAFSACTWIGVSLDGDAGTLTGGFNSITGNNIISCGTDSTANSDYGGIFVGESKDNVITGNVCKGSIWHGIRLVTSAHRNVISGNVCQGNSSAGILVSTSDDVVISGNDCAGNGTYGIDVFSSPRAAVLANKLALNGSDGLRFAGTGTGGFATANGINNNSGYGINVSTSSVSSVHLGVNSFLSNSSGEFSDSGTSTRMDDRIATGRAWHGLINGTHSTVVATANRMYLLPVMVGHRTRFDRVRFQVVTSSGSCQVGLYNADLVRIASSATSACPSTGIGSIVLSSSVDVNPGVYYIALQFDNATASTIFITDNVGTMISMGYQDVGSFGLPATASLSALGSTALKALVTNA